MTNNGAHRGNLRDYYEIQHGFDDHTYNTIYVDIDLPFATFWGMRIYRYVKDSLIRMGVWTLIDKTYIRKSSSGNVHLKVVIRPDCDVTFPMMLVIRAMLYDDIYRIGLDLRRIARQSEREVNRIFSTKIKDGGIHHVGKWIEWDKYVSVVEIGNVPKGS